MNAHALIVNGLIKRYPDFTLDDITFAVPSGSIVGLIGENGLGKRTTLNAILGLIEKDAGTITILDRQDKEIDNSTRNQIGVVFDGNHFPEVLSAKKLNHILKNIYKKWDEKRYFAL